MLRRQYIRTGSRSIVAQGVNHTRLIELTAKLPFDDRINQQAKLNDLDLGMIREFLQEIGSELFDESVNIPFPEICRQMQIARGPVEYLRPVNAGLMFFNREPHNFLTAPGSNWPFIPMILAGISQLKPLMARCITKSATAWPI